MAELTAFAIIKQGFRDYIHGKTYKSFNDQATKFHKEKNYLTDLETYEVGGQRRWAGVFDGPSKPSGSWLIWDVGIADFLGWVDKLKQESGARLVDIEAYTKGGKVTWAGVFNPGNWQQDFVYGLGFNGFEKKVQELFKKGLRLISLQTYVEDGKRKWAGVFRSGNWSLWWKSGMTYDTFKSETKKQASQYERFLEDVETYMDLGKRKWAAIWRGGGSYSAYFMTKLKDLDSDATSIELSELRTIWKLKIFEGEGIRDWQLFL